MSALEEAHRRYDGDWIISGITGERESFDDWGYAETARSAFVAGVEWGHRDQAEKIIEWIESKNLGGVYPDFQTETEYHAALRKRFRA